MHYPPQDADESALSDPSVASSTINNQLSGGTPNIQRNNSNTSDASSLEDGGPPPLGVPLAENTLMVDISDALSEKDKVKFTVHTRTTLPGYAKPDIFVVRQHEEFVWLHDRFEENEAYGGYIVSCAFSQQSTHKLSSRELTTNVSALDSAVPAASGLRCVARETPTPRRG